MAVDALLDQIRTAINVWGDGTASFVIDASEGKTTTQNIHYKKNSNL